ncbi:hypothetical protein JRO89_XS13G0226300 [Xanthoceras sorbifolium]|uniref:Uncharacterized protein n=1 Tax=Xanthoceras sorbifolium TaxID=99658 RepID=A0ABQ8H9I4_9ROSI|nr:hypothetical protein JRO89_XS13G0226300 [Xanthoceras sorbifolium]
MAGREVREYTNLSDPKDKKWGKGKDKIDDEDITFQRMVAKMQEVAGERGGYLHGRGEYECVCVLLRLFRAALDSDDLLYLKEQMEAEQDAERLLRRTEKRAFAAFKISFLYLFINTHTHALSLKLLVLVFSPSLTNAHKAASLADSSPASVPLPLRVEPKPKSGIRQQDLLKKVVEVKPKKPRVSSPSDGSNSTQVSSSSASKNLKTEVSSPSDGNHPIQISSNSASKGLKSEVDPKKEQEQISLKSNKAEGLNEVENPVKSLLGLAYASSDDED